ncbi:hypothetical protein [Clostridium sp.]|uniref:hypothetical protein n=1 Tax=Clostridium sp. TaxID=1506 RepID=UPI003F4B7638
MGFLPGTEEEKLKPWMGSFYDSVESLMDMKSNNKKNNLKNKKNKKINQHERENTFGRLGYS